MDIASPGSLSGQPPQRSTADRLTLPTRDFDQFALAFRGWDATFRQLTGGTFEGRIEVVRQGPLDAFRICSNRVIQARGIHRTARCNFGLVLPGCEGSHWRGRSLRTGQFVVLPPDAVMDHRSRSNVEYLALSVDYLALCQAMRTLRHVDLETELPGWHALTASPAAMQRLERFVRQWLRGRAGAIAQPVEFGVRLLAELLDARPVSVDRREKRRHARQRAEAYMNAHLHTPISVSELCQETDVSERTLEYAFREEFGLTPMAYFKACRLNAVRAELKRGTEDSIVHILQTWGFTHPGAFAADYRRLFGELPSQTRSTARKVTASGR